MYLCAPPFFASNHYICAGISRLPALYQNKSLPVPPGLCFAACCRALLVVTRLGVLIQAVLPRADLVVAHECIDYAAPAVTAGPLSGPGASASPVEMVADRLTVVSGSLGLG